MLTKAFRSTTNKDATVKKDGQANESSGQEPASVESEPGKVDGDPLPEVFPDVVERLVLEPTAPAGPVLVKHLTTVQHWGCRSVLGWILFDRDFALMFRLSFFTALHLWKIKLSVMQWEGCRKAILLQKSTDSHLIWEIILVFSKIRCDLIYLSFLFIAKY